MARKKTDEPAGEAKIADYRYDDSNEVLKIHRLGNKEAGYDLH